jgi:chaperone LolA
MLGALFAPAHAFPGDDAESLLKQIEKKYDGIKDASVTFTRQIVFGVTKAEHSFSGKLLMKKGNKYRIELEDETIVTDGKSVWRFTKSYNQVFIDKYKEGPQSFSPDKILVDVPRHYSVSLLGEEKVQGQETSILKLIPVDPRSSVQWMKVWVDSDRLMKKIQVFDLSDNLATYLIDTIKINTGLDDSPFTFPVPDGVEIIDVR